MTIQDVYNKIDQAAPFSLAMEFDNPGLLVGDPSKEVNGALVALDVTDEVISEAVSRGANLIVTHHPVIYSPLKRVTSDLLVWKLVRENLSVISAHTNLDIARGGVNDILAEKLALSGVETLPPDHMVRVGTVERGMTPPEFAYYVKRMLELPAVRYCDGGQAVERVAVCGGSGGSCLEEVIASGAQAFVTGDVKHSVMLEAVHRGITLIDAGHYGTEHHVLGYLSGLVRDALGGDAVAIARSDADPATVI